MEFKLNASLQTSSFESNVENLAFVSVVRLFFNRLKSTSLHLSFKDLKTETSNGCSKSVVSGSNFNIVTLLILTCLIVS